MFFKIISAVLVSMLLVSSSYAADRKMVIQVNSNDRMTQKIALNNAKNLKNMLGNDAVDVEIVVYGPGVSFLKSANPMSDQITALIADKNVKVSVCGGTLKALAKRNNGKEPDIIPGINRVPTGAIRILELQEQGYAYMRP